MLFKYISRSEFSKNVFTLITGTAIAQGISILISPLLTRLYAPKDFAVFAVFSSIVSIAGVVATARYEMAIVLPKEEKDAFNLTGLCLLISLGISMVVFLAILGYDLFIAEKYIGFSKWFYLIPLSVLLTGIYATFNYWSTRKKTFKKNSAARIGTTGTSSIVTLGLGFAKFSSPGMISGFLLGQLTGVLILAHEKFFNLKEFLKNISKEGMLKVMRQYKNFATINSPHALFDSFIDNGIVFVLAYYFLSPIVGFYAFAFRLLKAPVGLIGSAFYQVFYQKISDARNNNEDIRPMILSIYKKMFFIGLPGFFLLFLFTPDVFSFIFGDKWREAGVIAQILLPWLFLNFIASPVSAITLVYGKQKEAFFITGIDFILRLIALLIGGKLNDYKIAFTLLSIFGSLLMIFAMLWFYRIPKQYKSSLHV